MSASIVTPARHTVNPFIVRLNAHERCHEVVNIHTREVVASFYWDEAPYFAQPSIEAGRFADALNYNDARRAA